MSEWKGFLIANSALMVVTSFLAGLSLATGKPVFVALNLANCAWMASLLKRSIHAAITEELFEFARLDRKAQLDALEGRLR